mgnify:CR=1 FL=1
MNYGEIKYYDIANGIGVRTSLFVSGCRNRCEDCFNRETWAFDFGKPYTEETENAIIESLRPDYIAGLTVLGGEPFEPENQEEVLKLIKRVKSELPNKTVWIYSGFTFEEILSGSRASGETANEILSVADVLVDGRFDKTKKNVSLKFRGSENQRIIDLGPSLLKKTVVLKEL